MNLRSIDAEALLVLYRQGLAEAGSDASQHDSELLGVAFSYPLEQVMSGTADVAAIAAAYAAGMLKHRPFASGNEQAAFLAMGLFLYVNDWRLSVSQDEATAMMRRVVAGDASEDELADWIRKNL
jgi:death-on-curing protein